MNLVGKIFTVLILVMSVFFGALAVAVYATHKNWKKVVTNPSPLPGEKLGLTEQLEQQKKRREELEDQKLNLERELSAQKSARIDAVKRLENEKVRLSQEIARFKEQHDELVKAEREAVAAMKSIQETLAQLRGDLDTATKQVDETRQDKDAHFKEVVRLTDELHQLVNELKRIRARQVELAEDLAKAEEVLRLFGLVSDPAAYTGTPPDVDGVVLAVPRSDLVEVSIGSDDGLMKGHTLQVYRLTGGGPTYVGRIEVVKTEPDRSACKVDPKWQKSNVQRGDRVTSLQLNKPNA